MSQSAHVGDVFLIPIDASRSGIGQIAGDWKGELYIVVYEAAFNGEQVDPDKVLTEKPLLAALSMDAKIRNGDWRVIGNLTTNLASIPQPVFKIWEGGKEYLESRDRKMTRPASRTEAEASKLRTVVSPIRLENALKAHHGVGEWTAKFDELRYEYAWQSSKFNR